MTPSLSDLEAYVASISGDVLGVVLSGSMARTGTTGAHSDADLIIVVADDAAVEIVGPTGIDVAVYRLGRLARIATPHSDPDDWWNRYAFVGAHVLVDNMSSGKEPGGGIRALVDRQATLGADEQPVITTELLDGYLNYAYRSLKSARDGRTFESRLDAVESIAWALGTLFALESRIRPYNKYLRWELAERPLDSIDSTALLRLLEDIRVMGDAGVQRELVRTIIAAARVRGHGDTVDSWGDSLAILLG